MSKNITAISKVVSKEALEVLENKLQRNVWATPSRTHPNAEKLKDGAIQRVSCTPDLAEPYVKKNPDLIGVYKRPELNERAGQTAAMYSNPWEDFEPYRNRIARIYQP